MAAVYWITGLSGAGKTTIGEIFYQKLKYTYPNTVFLDGDILRKIFGDIFGYNEEERKRCAMCYSRLCDNLQKQGINVVCCTVSMFDCVRAWNREYIQNYIEIYLKVSLDTLRKRDKKGLYSGNTKEKQKDVAGITFNFEEPQTPDLIINNEGDISPEVQAMKIWNYASGKIADN